MIERMSISKKMFNPLYWHVLSALRNNDIRYIYIKGGSSAGKTYAISQALSIDSMQRRYNSLVIRKIGSDIRDTVFNDFKEITSKFNKDFDIFDIGLNTIKVFDSIMRFRGLDKPEKIKGISSYRKVFVNEVTGLNYDDWKELRRRLRGRENQQLIADWNPIDRNHWMKKKVIDQERWIDLPNSLDGMPESELDKEHSFVKINEKGDSLYISTTYRDNYWIVGHPENPNIGFYDKHTIEEFETMRIREPEDYQVYGLAAWGVLTQRLIFKNWDVVDEIPKEAKKIPYGLDFGMSPDPTALVDLYTLKKDNIHYLYIDEKIYNRNLLSLTLGEGNESDSIESKLEEQGIKKNELIIADSAGKREIRALRSAGYNIWGAKKGQGSILYGIRVMKNYYICITSRSQNIINEFENYKRKVDQYGNILPEPMDEDNHGIDATRYVLLNKGRLW